MKYQGRLDRLEAYEPAQYFPVWVDPGPGETMEQAKERAISDCKPPRGRTVLFCSWQGDALEGKRWG